MIFYLEKSQTMGGPHVRIMFVCSVHWFRVVCSLSWVQ